MLNKGSRPAVPGGAGGQNAFLEQDAVGLVSLSVIERGNANVPPPTITTRARFMLAALPLYWLAARYRGADPGLVLATRYG
jgi:hypothetical protein